MVKSSVVKKVFGSLIVFAALHAAAVSPIASAQAVSPALAAAKRQAESKDPLCRVGPSQLLDLST